MELTFRSKNLEVTVREPGDGTKDDMREDCDGYRALMTRLLLSIELCRLEYVLARVVVDMAEAGETGRLFETESDAFVAAAIAFTERYEELDEANQEADARIKGYQNGTT